MQRKIKWRAFLIFICLAFMLTVALHSNAEAAEGVGRISAVTGQADILRQGKLPAVVAKEGDSLSVGDIVRTKNESKCEITFNDGNIVRMAQMTRVDVHQYAPNTKAALKLPRGKIESIVKQDLYKGSPNFQITTPNAVAGVRGTEFFVYHDNNMSGVVVKQGIVGVANPKFPDKVVVVTAGNMTTVPAQSPPQAPRQAKESDMKRLEKDVAPEKKADKAGDKDKSESKGDDKGKDKQESKAASSDDKSKGGDSKDKAKSDDKPKDGDSKDKAKVDDKPKDSDSKDNTKSDDKGDKKQAVTDDKPKSSEGKGDSSSGEQGKSDDKSKGGDSKDQAKSDDKSKGGSPKDQAQSDNKPKDTTTGGEKSDSGQVNKGSSSQGSSGSATQTAQSSDQSQTGGASDKGPASSDKSVSTDKPSADSPKTVVASSSAAANEKSGPVTILAKAEVTQTTSTTTSPAPTGITPAASPLTSSSTTTISAPVSAPVAMQISAPTMSMDLSSLTTAMISTSQVTSPTGTTVGQSITQIVTQSQTTTAPVQQQVQQVVMPITDVQKDTTPPVISIVGKPADITNMSTANFTISSDAPSTLYVYTLDGVVVASPTLTSLPAGNHTFSVTAKDAAGNVSAPQSYTWTTDYTPPTLTAKTATLAGATDVRVVLTTNKTATYSYKIDSNPWTTSDGIVSLGSLSAGAHTVSFSAADAAGNTTTISDTVNVVITGPGQPKIYSFGAGGNVPVSVTTGIETKAKFGSSDTGSWTASAIGTYNPGSSPLPSNWATSSVGNVIILGREITDGQWSGNIMTGTDKGYYASIAAIPETGIYIGGVKATFDPNTYSIQFVRGGTYVETGKLLQMVCPNNVCNTSGSNLSADQAKLNSLNIPVVEVGRTSLSGAGNNLNVTISNVIFFAPTSGGAPAIWAAGSNLTDVSGTYSASPALNTSVGLTNGSGISANFTPTTWDTTNNKWLATMSGGGNLTGGSFTGKVGLQGALAGSLTPTPQTAGGSFRGSAAGIIGNVPNAGLNIGLTFHQPQ